MNPHLCLLRKEDLAALSDRYFPWTTKSATLEMWTRYFDEQEKRERLAYLIQVREEIAGYGHLIFKPKYASFREKNIPEISDLRVYEGFQGKGLGSLLINHLENIAKTLSYSEIGIGVGLYKDYGAAQRLYIKLNYIPDGNGVTYNTSSVIPGSSYPVDDDLILWLIKSLEG